MVKLVTSDLVVQAMNAVAREEEIVDQLPEIRITPESDVAESQQSTSEVIDCEPNVEQEEIEELNQAEETVQTESGAEDEASEADESAAEEEGIQTTRSGRRILKPARYAAVTKIESKQWKEEATDTAIKAELTLLFKDLKALRVIR
jgi:hypothetical protein